MLLRMISAPLRPSSTRRVGATRRSPTPAPAGVGTNATPASTAERMDLVQKFITATPTLLRAGAVAAIWVRNGLFSVNHDRKIGPQPSIIHRHVEGADISPGGGRR